MVATSQHQTRICRLISTRTEMEAGLIVATLEENGIKATLTGASTSGFRAEAPGEVHVLVSEEDLPRAAAVLQEVEGSEGVIDWSSIDVGAPDQESESGSERLLWLTSLRWWRRVAFVFITLYLLWIGAEIVRGVIRLFAGEFGG